MDCNTLELAPLLEAWPFRLMTDRRWAYAEPPLPEIEPMPLDAIWVDVTVVDPLEEAGSDLTGDVVQAMDSRYEDRQLCSEPASFVLERLRGSAALIGDPGIGKTTLLKWMAGQLIRQSDGRFLLPLYVPLRAYSLEKSENVDMVSFALQQCGIVRSPQIAKWKNTLEYLSGVQKKTVLLLLDGWDEVPADRRESLRTEMESLSYRFAFIITSRHSAYPASLPVDRLHEITDLPPQGIHTLIHNWFRAAGHPEMTDRLFGHLDAHPDLRRMARNPFLLNLICGICFSDAGHSGHDDLPASRTELYRFSGGRCGNWRKSRTVSVSFLSDWRILWRKPAPMTAGLSWWESICVITSGPSSVRGWRSRHSWMSTSASIRRGISKASGKSKKAGISG